MFRKNLGFRWFAFVFFMLAAGSAQAVTYTFSGSSFPSCAAGWSLAGSTWTCAYGNVSLGAGDNILPASNITIKVNASFTLNGNNTIGSASARANLSTDYGTLTLKATSTVYGNLTTSSGAVSLTGTTVNGTLTTNGTLTISGGGITGNVSAKNGITSTNGAEFGGNVTATNGTLTLTGGSVAGAVHSGCCVVTTNNTNVGNGVSSGAVNGSGGSTVIINGGTVSGNILTNGGSGISINNGANVTGNVTSNCCTVVINNSTVTGNITSNGGSGVQIQNGSTITGNVNAPNYQAPATVVDQTSIVHGTCDSQTNSSNDPGSYENRCDGGVTGSTTTVKFNACHNYSSGNCEAVSGRLYTRLVGTAFSVDVVALKSGGSVDTSFDKKATVTLIARSAAGSPPDANNCFVPDYSQTLDNAATAFTSGRLTIDNINVTSAYPDVRINVSCDSANCATPIAAACSTDNFAIRPVDFTVTSSNAYADGNGSSTTATPTVKAGTPFSLTAETVAGYNGTPKVSMDPDLLSAHSDAVAKEAVSGSFSPASNGTATGNAFTYSEVGYFRFNTRGVYDDTFTEVDQNQLENDCTNDYSNMLAGGKYGCKFGNIAETAYFGRFIPDHFNTEVKLASGVPMGCPAELECPDSYNGFVYSGQPFTLNVSAMNSSDVKMTQNYQGDFSKDVTLSAVNALGGATAAPGGALTAASAPSDSFANGRTVVPGTPAAPVFTFATAPTAPTDVYVRALDTDGVTSLRDNASESVEGGVKVASGRVMMSNAYGSELLPLSLNATVQYYNGTAWVLSSTDTEMAISAANFALAFPSGTGNPNNLAACETVLSVTGTSPEFKVGLTAPGIGNAGWTELTLNLGTAAGQQCTAPGGAGASSTSAAYSWLQFPEAMSPKARATFGIYKGNSKFIYIREQYY